MQKLREIIIDDKSRQQAEIIELGEIQGKSKQQKSNNKIEFQLFSFAYLRM